MHLKPLIYGFITGVVLVFVAAMGLVIGLVEFLQPLLSPGTELLRGYAENFPINPLIAGVVLNGIIYAVLFSVVATARRMFTGTKRTVALVLLAIAFLTLTGMMGDLLAWSASPDKWWIFNVGA